MSDFRLVRGDNGWDLAIGEGDFESESNLRSAAVLSVLTHRRVTRDDVPEGSLRGYWADADWGSSLWLLGRAKTQPNLTSRAERYVEEALQWMINEGIASSVEVTATLTGNRLDVCAVIRVINGDDFDLFFEDVATEDHAFFPPAVLGSILADENGCRILTPDGDCIELR